MRVRVSVQAREAKRVRDKLKEHITKTEHESWSGDLEMVRILWQDIPCLTVFVSLRLLRGIDLRCEIASPFCTPVGLHKLLGV